MKRRLRYADACIASAGLVLVFMLSALAFRLWREQSPSHHAALAPAVSITHTYGGGVSAAQQCQSYGTGCARMLVQMMNRERATYGAPALTLNWSMVHGTTNCIGATGNAKSMALAGFISHSHFPSDVCYQWTSAAENVGEYPGSKYSAALGIHALMEAEPIGPGYSNHHTNILSASSSQVGIGFAQSNGTWYVAEEFAG